MYRAMAEAQSTDQHRIDLPATDRLTSGKQG